MMFGVGVAARGMMIGIGLAALTVAGCAQAPTLDSPIKAAPSDDYNGGKSGGGEGGGGGGGSSM